MKILLKLIKNFSVLINKPLKNKEEEKHRLVQIKKENSTILKTNCNKISANFFQGFKQDRKRKIEEKDFLKNKSLKKNRNFFYIKG